MKNSLELIELLTMYKVNLVWVSSCSNTRSVWDDSYWTSGWNNLELINVSSIDKVSFIVQASSHRNIGSVKNYCDKIKWCFSLQFYQKQFCFNGDSNINTSSNKQLCCTLGCRPGQLWRYFRWWTSEGLAQWQLVTIQFWNMSSHDWNVWQGQVRIFLIFWNRLFLDYSKMFRVSWQPGFGWTGMQLHKLLGCVLGKHGQWWV